jgi:hypothetical protein
MRPAARTRRSCVAEASTVNFPLCLKLEVGFAVKTRRVAGGPGAPALSNLPYP